MLRGFLSATAATFFLGAKFIRTIFLALRGMQKKLSNLFVSAMELCFGNVCEIIIMNLS